MNHGSPAVSARGQQTRFVRRSLLLLIGGGLLVVGVLSLPQGVADLLIRDDTPRPTVEYEMLLMGDSSPTRALAALAAYQQGYAKKIVMAQEDPSGFIQEGYQKSYTEVHFEYLKAHGVPEVDLVVLRHCVAGSTLDEAHCLDHFLDTVAARPSQVMVVTSWYHSSRAGWLFQRVLEHRGIKVSVVAASGMDSSPTQWWHYKLAVLDILSEYIKWTYWLVKQPR